MDWKGALRARVLAAVPASVGSKVYWVERPQATALPAVTLQTIDDGRPRTFDGFQGSRPSVVQIDVWATNQGNADGTTAITEAIIAELGAAETSNGIKFLAAQIDGVQDLGERVETAFIHRTRIDVIIWHSPA